MRHLALSILALAACNDVFGLHPTKLRDGDVTFFDAPADSAFVCPPPAALPAFKTDGKVVISQPCGDYTRSEAGNLAVAVCNTSTISQAPLAAMTMQPSQFASSVDVSTLSFPQLAPEGDTLYVITSGGTGQQLVSLTRAADDSWQAPTIETVTIANLPFGWNHSAPSLAPGRRMLGIGGDSAFHEYAEQSPHMWTDLGAIPGTVNDAEPQLTSDGLRLVGIATISAQVTILYAARASLSDPFPMPMPLPTVATNRYMPYLSSDCGTLYVTDFSEVLSYEQQ